MQSVRPFFPNFRSATDWSPERQPPRGPQMEIEAGPGREREPAEPFSAYIESRLNKLTLRHVQGKSFSFAALDLTGLDRKVSEAWTEGANETFEFDHRGEKLLFEIRPVASGGFAGVVRDQHGTALLRSLRSKEETQFWDEGDCVVRFHFLDAKGKSVGRGFQRFSPDGTRTETLNVLLSQSVRNLGLVKTTFQYFLSVVPAGCELQMISANELTNQVLNHFVEQLNQTVTYLSSSDLDAELTRMALKVTDYQHRSGLLWVHLLQSSGWQDLSIRRNPGCANYWLTARKIPPHPILY